MGEVLNDSPVGCQIRDRTEPAGESDSPRFHQNEKHRLCGVFCLEEKQEMGSRTWERC